MFPNQEDTSVTGIVAAAGKSGIGYVATIPAKTGTIAYLDDLLWSGATDSNIYNINTGFVGIGTTSPSSLLHLVGEGVLANTLEQYYSNAVAPNITYKKARGTISSPSNVITNDAIGRFTFYGYYSGATPGFASGAQARIEAKAEESFIDSTHLGTYLSFATTALSGNTLTERMRISAVGYVGFGITPTSRLTLAEGTTADSGITFGTDTNLYRSAANQLKTDDSLNVVGTLQQNGINVSTSTNNEDILGTKTYLDAGGGLKLGDASESYTTTLRTIASTGSYIVNFPDTGGTVLLDTTTNILTTNTNQTISGVKTFNPGSLKVLNASEAYGTLLASNGDTSVKTATFPNLTGNVLLDTSTFTRYSLQVGATTVNMSDGTTYYFGGRFALAPQTTAARCSVYIPYSGTVKAIYINWYNATITGSTETGATYFRYNNTTDTLIGNSAFNTTTGVVSNTGLNIAVTQGSYFEIKYVAPTWTTNPTGMYLSGVVYIE